jgi:hypothetical protein
LAGDVKSLDSAEGECYISNFMGLLEILEISHSYDEFSGIGTKRIHDILAPASVPVKGPVFLGAELQP